MEIPSSFKINSTDCGRVVALKQKYNQTFEKFENVVDTDQTHHIQKKLLYNDLKTLLYKIEKNGIDITNKYHINETHCAQIASNYCEHGYDRLYIINHGTGYNMIDKCPTCKEHDHALYVDLSHELYSGDY